MGNAPCQLLLFNWTHFKFQKRRTLSRFQQLSVLLYIKSYKVVPNCQYVYVFQLLHITGTPFSMLLFHFFIAVTFDFQTTRICYVLYRSWYCIQHDFDYFQIWHLDTRNIFKKYVNPLNLLSVGQCFKEPYRLIICQLILFSETSIIASKFCLPKISIAILTGCKTPRIDCKKDYLHFIYLTCWNQWTLFLRNVWASETFLPLQ